MFLTRKILYSVTLLIGLMTTAFTTNAQTIQCTLIKNGQLAQPGGGSSPYIQIHTVSTAAGGSEASGVNACGGYFVSPAKVNFSSPNESVVVNLYFSGLSFSYNYYVSLYIDGVLAYKTSLQTYYPSMGSNVQVTLSPVSMPVNANTVEVRLTNS